MLGVDSQHLATVQLVAEMRRLFQEQVAVASAAETMTTGQMLLCAANTLFDKVDGEMVVLRERTAECGGAALEWARLGLVRGAAEVASAAFSPTPGVWESLAATVFVAKLQLLRDFFSLCSRAGRAFQGEGVAGALPTGETLVAPVRRFVTDFLALMVAGAGPRHAATTVVVLLRDSGYPRGHQLPRHIEQQVLHLHLHPAPAPCNLHLQGQPGPGRPGAGSDRH